MGTFWYTMQTISGLEEKTREKLTQANPQLETFLPKRELNIRRQGKVKKVVEPLFPGYFFICLKEPMKFDLAQKFLKEAGSLGLRKGIIRVVGADLDNRTIAPVKNLEIEPIIELAGEAETVTFSKFLKKGNKVVIIEGPLLGKEVIIRKVNGRKNRITIELQLMGKTNKIDIGGLQVASVET